MHLTSVCRPAGLALALVLQTLPLLAAPDWPQWRGPNRDDVSTETGLLKSWPAGGPPLAWKATGVGAGFATVSVAGDRIFTAGDIGSESRVIALNRGDGKEVWSAKLGAGGAVGWGGFVGVRGTPTVAADLVFALSQWGDLACFEAATGKEVWRKSFTNDFSGKLPEWGFAESPLVDGDQVVGTPGGEKGAVVALNKRTGAVLWRTTDFTDEAQYSSLVPVDSGGVRQYVLLTMQNVVGIAAKDGQVLWKAPRKGATAVISTPVWHDGWLYVSSQYGIGCNGFKVTAENGTFRAEQVYANKVMDNQHGGIVGLGDLVYGYSDKNGWVCQELKTGKQVWAEKEKFGKGSLTFADGHFYLREEDKGASHVALIEASPDGYRESGRFEQPGHSGKEAWTHPVVCDGKLYLRDQDTLFCYDVKAR